MYIQILRRYYLCTVTSQVYTKLKVTEYYMVLKHIHFYSCI